MKKLCLISIFILSTLGVYAQFSKATIDSLSQLALKKSGTEGAYISILKNDAIIYSSPCGFNDAEQKMVITDSTVFPISSNTKAFNSLLLAQLVNDEMLNYDAPIKTHLPDLEFINKCMTDQITLIDLLTHRIGIPRYDMTYYNLSEEEKKNANKAVFKKLRYLESSSDFRTQFQYGNNQYIVASYLLEELTKEKWENRLQRKVLDPLGMEDTHCDLNKYLATKNIVYGHQDKMPVDINYVAPLYNVSGMGNMFSTVRDLEKWCNFLLNGNDSILPKDWIDYTMAGHFSVGYEEPYEGFSPMQYGLGWYVFEYFGHKVVLHHGDNVGHQSLIVLLPEDDVSWVIISNEGMRPYGVPFIMTYYLLDLLLERKVTDWVSLLKTDPIIDVRHEESMRNPNIKPTLKMNEYVGTYAHKGFGKFEITEENGVLTMHTEDTSFILEHWESNTFRHYSRIFKEDYIFQFYLDEENKVVSMKTDFIERNVNMTILERKR